MIKDIENVISSRKSIRTYNNVDIEPEKKKLILDFAKSNSVGLFGNKINFYWIDGSSDEFKNVKLGTYGVISGTKNFIVGKVGSSEQNLEDYGYCMEKLILYCTQLNIGTCWLGGTYNKTAFSTVIDLRDDEFIPAVTPVGYFGTRKSTIDKMFRRMVGANNRKPVDELFFLQSFSQSLTEVEKEKYGYLLEMIRLAPSASNKQPWRVVVSDGVLHFFLKRTPDYAKPGMQADLQRVDMGIAFAHAELALNERNIKHRWFRGNPGLELDKMTEYVASCEVG